MGHRRCPANMRLLLTVALLACLALAAHGKPSKKEQDANRQLVFLLKKLVMEEISKKSFSGASGSEEDSGSGYESGSGSEDADPYAVIEFIRGYLEDNIGAELDKPVFEADMDAIGHTFGAVVHILAANIPEKLGPLVAARFTQSFLDYVVYDGVCDLWRLADEFYHGIYENLYSGDSGYGSGDYYKRSSSPMDSLSKRSKNFERLDKALQKLSKGKRSLRSMQGKATEKRIFAGSEYSGYGSGFELDFYTVVYELESMAEDDGLLSRSLRDSAMEVTYHLAYYMFTPAYDGFLPDGSIIETMAQKVDDYNAGMNYLENADNFADVPLEGAERAAFMKLVTALAPMAMAMKDPLDRLSGHLRTGDPHEIAGFFLGVMAHVLSDQFEILATLENTVREGAEMKKDVIGRLVQAMCDGRGEEVFVAIFTKMGHSAVADGYRLDDFMYFAGQLLDQVDHDINPDAYGSGDFYLPNRGRSGAGRSGAGRSGASGASGAYKRFLKMSKVL